MSRAARTARYRLIFHPAVADDVLALAAHGPEVVDAVRVVLGDLAHGRAARSADRR